MSKYIDENEKSSDGTVFRKRRSGFTIPRSLSVAILPHLLFHRFFTFLLLLLIFDCFLLVLLARRSVAVALRRLFRCGVTTVDADEDRRVFLVRISFT